jgi:Clp protease
VTAGLAIYDTVCLIAAYSPSPLESELYRCRFESELAIRPFSFTTTHPSNFLVCLLPYTYILRRPGVFDGFSPPSSWFASQSVFSSNFISPDCSGERGKRHCLPNASIMIHRKYLNCSVLRVFTSIVEPSGGASGQASDIAIHAKEILRVRQLLTGIYQRHCSRPGESEASGLERFGEFSNIEWSYVFFYPGTLREGAGTRLLHDWYVIFICKSAAQYIPSIQPRKPLILVSWTASWKSDQKRKRRFHDNGMLYNISILSSGLPRVWAP